MHEQTKILKIRKVPAGEITITSQSVLRLLHGDLMVYRSFCQLIGIYVRSIEYFVYRDYLGTKYFIELVPVAPSKVYRNSSQPLPSGDMFVGYEMTSTV